MKPALLIIDVQKEFFSPASTQALNEAIDYINAGIEIFREKNLPVVCIQHASREDNLIPGQPGFDLPENLNILPSDLHIHKNYKNAFKKTPLAEELAKLGVDTVIIAGYAAEGCILSSYRGAEDLDLTPIILRGSIASGKPETIKLVEGVSDIISYNALDKFLS